MSSIGRRMTVGDYVFYLIFGDTSKEDIVGTSFEKKRLIPIVMFKIVQEFFLLLVGQVWWKHPNC
jgi:hypothetical protein